MVRDPEALAILKSSKLAVPVHCRRFPPPSHTRPANTASVVPAVTNGQTWAVPVAPEPPPPEIVRVRTSLARYPEPGLVSVRLVTAEPPTTAAADAPEPEPPPLNDTVGADVYPPPPLVTVIESTAPSPTAHTAVAISPENGEPPVKVMVGGEE